MPQPDSFNREASATPSDFGLSETEFKRDQLLGGRYRVLSLLGRGGMGIVYRVEQIFLGKELALKTIEKRSMTDVIVRRFRAEAKAAFAVDHPNIVAVHDFGVLDEQTPFLVMEIVEGSTLGDRIKRGALSLEEAIPIFVQVCFGLAHAHSCGVVHRDIKPNNIMLLSEKPEGIEGGVKILDFGIAKIAQSDDGEIQALTRTGEIFGSPLYMSPEQCVGSRVDHRADIYSLGCVMFETLTGSPPFIGENALSTMMLHQTARTPTLKEVSMGQTFPLELENLLQSMMEKDPARRLQNLGEAALKLGGILRGEKKAENNFAPPRAVPSLQRNKQKGTIAIEPLRFAAMHIGMGITAVLITSFLMFQFYKPKPVVNRPVIAQESDNEKRDELEATPSIKNAIQQNARYIKYRFAVDNFSLRIFDKYKNLRSLEIQEGSVDDDGLRHLLASKLLALNTHHCDISTVNNLCKFSYLQSLDLTATHINDDSLKQIAQSLKQLEYLSIEECRITADGLKAVPLSNSLAFLQVGDDQFSEQDLKALQAKMPQLTILLPKSKRMESTLAQFDKSNKNPSIEVLEQRLKIALKGGPRNWEVGNTYGRMGLLYASKNQFSEAEQMMKKADHLFATNGDTRQRVEGLLQLATYARRRGDIEETRKLSRLAAQALIDTLSELQPNLYEMYSASSAIPCELHDYETVSKISKAAIDSLGQNSTAPKDQEKYYPRFYYLASWSANLLNQPKDAKDFGSKYYTWALQSRDLNPKEFCRAQITFANSLHEPADSDQRKMLYVNAIAQIEKLNFPNDLALREHYCDACQNMALICAEEHKKEEAISYFDKALKLLKTTHHQGTNERIKLYMTQMKNIEKADSNLNSPSADSAQNSPQNNTQKSPQNNPQNSPQNNVQNNTQNSAQNNTQNSGVPHK